MSGAGFELKLKLGAGGMGSVHLARMTRGTASEWVALKRLHAALASPEDLARFEDEAKIGSLLDHPNLVRLRRWGVDDEGPFLALEFVDGRSAKELVAAALKLNQQLPLVAGLAIARDAARGLVYAHSFRDDARDVHHVVHRDIAPDNLLVSYDGVTRVSDFGIAHIVGGPTQGRTEASSGKVGFMAPELFEGQEADLRSDVFAFGSTLFQLLSSTAAFPGKSDPEVLRAMFSGPPLRCSAVAEVPAEIDDWIARALSRDPRERPPNLEQILELLEAQLADEVREGQVTVAEWMHRCFPLASDQRRTEVNSLLTVQSQTDVDPALIDFQPPKPPSAPGPERPTVLSSSGRAAWPLWAAAGAAALAALAWALHR